MNVEGEKTVARVSTALSRRELDLLNQALRVRWGRDELACQPQRRGRFIAQAIWAYAMATVEQKAHCAMGLLACDLRKETPDEFALRLSRPRAKLDAAQFKPVLITLEWMKERFPQRWS